MLRVNAQSYSADTMTGLVPQLSPIRESSNGSTLTIPDSLGERVELAIRQGTPLRPLDQYSMLINIWY